MADLTATMRPTSPLRTAQVRFNMPPQNTAKAFVALAPESVPKQRRTL